MSEGPQKPTPRYVIWLNALILFVAGPAMALLFYGIGWIVDRPHPLDVTFLLVRSVAVGFIVGTVASLLYLGSFAAQRLRGMRIRFRLRTLLLLLTLMALPIGWFAANLNWIRERRALEDQQSALLGEAAATAGNDWGNDFERRVVDVDHPSWMTSATLWLFGEYAREEPAFFYWGSLRPEEIERVQRLFPEASKIHFFGMPESTRGKP